MRNLIPWKKRKEMSQQSAENSIALFNREMNSLFDRFFDNDYWPSRRLFDEENWYPSIDVSEGKKKVTVKAELPGMDPKNIDISIDGRRLHIKGEKKQEKETKEETFYRVERNYGYFNRVIELPADVDDKDVSASYKKGILKVELKKAQPSNVKRIKVNTP